MTLTSSHSLRGRGFVANFQQLSLCRRWSVACPTGLTIQRKIQNLPAKHNNIWATIIYLSTYKFKRAFFRHDRRTAPRGVYLLMCMSFVRPSVRHVVRSRLWYVLDRQLLNGWSHCHQNRRLCSRPHSNESVIFSNFWDSYFSSYGEFGEFSLRFTAAVSAVAVFTKKAAQFTLY